MPIYSWLTLTQAINALQGRLANSTFWTQAELIVYLNESLRFWNALTEQWNQDFLFDFNLSTVWTNTGTLSGSPRLRSVTDAYLYTQMQYMLLEPPSGAGTWTGTAQFALADLQFALQKRTQELIQLTNANLVNLPPLPTTPGTRRTQLPDTILEPQRIRFLGVAANTFAGAQSGSLIIEVLASATGVLPEQYVTGTGIQPGTQVQSVNGNLVTLTLPTMAPLHNTPVQFLTPITLTREDTQAFQWFEPNYLQTELIPLSWSVSSEPPLAFDVDLAPNVAGTYDFIGLQSGPTFAPPAATLLGVPDDFSMLAMYGALGDLLSRENEATDRQRAAYCLKRFTDGIKIMKQSNWLLQATVNNVPVDTPSMFEMDSYSPEWQTDLDAFPTVVIGGMDFINTPPLSTGTQISLTLLANAPLPVLLTDFVQVSRDVFDVVLSYAQRLAAFKMGGEEWNSTAPLEADFYRAATETNKRLLQIGIFDDVLHSQGKREQVLVPR